MKNTITKAVALSLNHGQIVYSATMRNADGTALRARVNGAVKTWKREPARFRIPMKYGLKECFYITEQDIGDWLTVEPEKAPRIKRVRFPLPQSLVRGL